MCSKRVLYVDCYSGVAGDMLLAALLDAGAELAQVKQALQSLHAIKGEWDILCTSVVKSEGQIGAKYIKVVSKHGDTPLPPPVLDQSHQVHPSQHQHEHNHSHDNQPSSSSHSHEHNHNHNHDHDHIHNSNCSTDHAHSHSHDEAHSHTHQSNRGLVDIVNLIVQSNLSKAVKSRAIIAFYELAKVEAKVHRSTIENVHFHEVGAIDSIIDTLGVVVACELLGIDEVYCSPLPMGHGSVWAAHGQMPVPAPATLFLMQGMELCAGPKNVSGELITPTGACLIRALCGSYDVVVDTDGKTQEDILKQLESLIYNGDRQGQGKLPPGFVLESIGIGAGTKDFPKHPNIVRALIGRVSKEENTRVTIPNAQSLQIQKMICMEANIDDMTSEHLAHLCAILLESGANDVWQESIVMKKNRMACKLCALTEPSKINIIADCIFDNSTSIGVRVNSLERIALQRKIVQLDSKYGKVDVKISFSNGKVYTIKPEYEHCKQLAEQHNLTLKEVHSNIMVLIEERRNELAQSVLINYL